MAARTRRVVWTESAQLALDEVVAYIAQKIVADRAREIAEQFEHGRAQYAPLY